MAKGKQTKGSAKKGAAKKGAAKKGAAKKGRKKNGLFGSLARRAGEAVVKSARSRRAVSRAGSAYKKELKLEAKLERQRKRRDDAERAARRAVRKAVKPRRERNVAQGFYDHHGRFRPIRASKDYNEFRGGDFEQRSRRLQPETMTLSQYVRKQGGIKYRDDHAMAGEMRRLTAKESGARGLVMKTGKMFPEAMADSAREAGYSVPRGEGAFLDALAADASGEKVIRHPEWHNEQSWSARRPNRGRAASGRRSSQPGLFDGPAADAAKKKKSARVRSVHSDGNLGTVVGETRGWLRVKWDGGHKTALVQPDQVNYLNGRKGGKGDAKAKGFRVLGQLKTSGEWVNLGYASAKTSAEAVSKTRRSMGAREQRQYKKIKAILEFRPNPAAGAAKRPAKKGGTKKGGMKKGGMKKGGAVRPRAARAPRPSGHFDRDRRRRRNPAAPVEVEKLYREFLGQEPSGQVLNLYVPAGCPKDFAVIGPVEDLTLEDGRVLNLRGKGAWLGQAVVGGRRRIFVGLTQPFETFRNGEPVRETDLGLASTVAYWAKKPHIEGDNRLRCYEHPWGDEGGRRPRAKLTADGRLALVGGDYTTAKEGIRN